LEIQYALYRVYFVPTSCTLVKWDLILIQCILMLVHKTMESYNNNCGL